MQFIAAILQEFRTCSKLDAILRRFLTKLNHKGPFERFCHAGLQFVFVWLWLIQTKHLHSSMSSSSPSTGNSISDTQTGSSSKVFLNIHAYLPVHFPSCELKQTKEIQTNKEKDRVETKELVSFVNKACACAIVNLLLKVTVNHGLISNRAVSRR